MYENISQGFISEVNGPSPMYSVKFDFTDFAYDNNSIYSCKVKRATSDDKIHPGTTVISTIEIDVTEVTTIMKNKTCTYYVGVEVGEQIEYVPLGVFRVSDCIKNGDRYTIKLEDNMVKTERLYISDLSFPATTTKMLNEIQSKTGVIFDLTGFVSTTIESKLEGYTCREIIGFIAGLNGKFAVCDRTGNVCAKWYTDSGYTFSENAVDEPEIAETDTVIEKVICQTSDSTLSKGFGNVIEYDNVFMTQELFNNVYSCLNGFTYRAGKINLRIGNPLLDVWDVVTLTYDNQNLAIPVCSLDEEFNGSFTQTIEVPLVKETEEQSSYKSPATKQMERLVAELVAAKLVLADKVSTDYLEANYTDILKADILLLNTDVANIATMLAGSVGAGIVQTIHLTAENSVLDESFVKNQIANRISVADLLAGAISTNKFRIVSDNGKLLIVDNTLQISDDRRVRVQLGKDSVGDYTLAVWDRNGNLMFDALGIREDAIKSGIIRNDMISEKANISGGKIDIKSLFEVINDSEHTINSTHVWFEDEAQSLGVIFKSLSSTVTAEQEKTSALQTSVSVLSGQISNKIWQSDVTTAIDNLEIGGRNLLLESDVMVEVTSKNTTTNIYYFESIITSNTSGDFDYLINEELTYSFNVESLGDCEELGSGAMLGRFGGHANAMWANEDYSQFKSTNIAISSLKNHGKKARCSSTSKITAPDGFPHLYTLRANLQTYSRPTNPEVIWKIGQPKLELGNKATDWTPAPEDTLNYVDEKITTLSDKYSDITQTVDTIKLEVKSVETEITTVKQTVDNLEIGGRNLALGTSNIYSEPFSNFDGAANRNINIGKVLTDGLSVGDTAIVRMVYKHTDIVAADGQYAQVSITGKGDVTGWDSGSLTGFKRTIISGSGELEIKHSFVVSENHIKNSYWSINLRHDYVASGSVQFKMFKVERGNKATDWTPAPEDALNYVDEKITQSESETYATIEQTAQAITATVSATYATKTDVANIDNVLSSKVSSLTQDVAGFKLSVADTYATKTQLNGVEGNFVNYSTTTQMQSAINQSANNITLAVQKDINTVINDIESELIINYTKKAEIIMDINNQGSNIKIKADKIDLTGAITANETFKIDESGYMEAIGGKIGGWEINSNYLYASTLYGYTTLKNNGAVAFATGSPTPNVTTGASMQIFHNGEVRVGADKSNQLRIVNGNIDIYYDDKKVGALGVGGLSGNWVPYLNSDYFLVSGDTTFTNKIKVAGGITTASISGPQGTIATTSLNVSGYIEVSSLTATAVSTSYLTVNSNAALKSSVTIADTMTLTSNGKYIKGAAKSGSLYNMLGISTNDNLVLGNASQEGNTHIYTNANATVRIYTGTTYNSIFSSAGLKFSNSCGILLNDAFAFRYYGSAVFCGIETRPLRLVGSTVNSNGSTVTSDIRLKNSINNLSDKYITLFENLEAKSYKYNNYRQETINCGFIAQEVLSALSKSGLTTKDFGGFVDVFKNGSEYALDYSQFTPILWSVAKINRNRIEELENKVRSLENQIAELTA